jgi:hypothetical protein
MYNVYRADGRAACRVTGLMASCPVPRIQWLRVSCKVDLRSSSWISILRQPRRGIGAGFGKANSFDDASRLLELAARLRD